MIDVAAPAQRLLDAVVDHFADHDWDLPPRRYIAAGQQAGIAADDEHLAVALATVQRGASENSRGGGSSPAYGAGAAPLVRAEYLLRLMRCVAVVDDDGTPPTAQQIHADGLRLLEDPGHLLAALYAWGEAEPHNATVNFGPIEPVGPEGGLAGHLVRVTLAPVQDWPAGAP